MTNDRRGAGWKQLREFPMVRRSDGSGRLVFQAQIVCATCGKTCHHLKRGALESSDYFERKGWLVGNNADHDFCLDCQAKKGKVVKMSDHKPPAPQQAEREMSKEDGRLLSRTIEDHWDDAGKRYRQDWSDVRLSIELGVPITWVREIRERDFGGMGEDPNLAPFLAAQIEVKREMDDLHGHLERMVASVAAMDTLQSETTTKTHRMIDTYRDRHVKLAARVHDLAIVAERLQPSIDKAG